MPVWNRDANGPNFEPGVPWLLRQFDQLRFHPVEPEELLDLRADFRAGRHELAIEPATFRLAAQHRFVTEHAVEIGQFRARQQEAFTAERLRWQIGGEVSGA